MKPETKKNIEKGYCRISNKYRIVSRIDREDWKEYMAKKVYPWSTKEGMDWVNSLGDWAEDHYRRCHSKDILEGVSEYKCYPESRCNVTQGR